MPPRDSDPPSSSPRPSVPHADPRDAGDEAPVSGEGPAVGEVVSLHSFSTEDVRAFLALPETRRQVTAIVGARVPSRDVENLVQDSLEEALRALGRRPPSRRDGLPGWVATVSRRVVADFLAKRSRRARYEGSMPEEPWDEGPGRGAPAVDAPSSFAEPSYDPRSEGDDAGVSDWLVRRWLAEQVENHPRDKETFEILLEHAREGKPYGRIADERGMTLTALSSRIFEFKGKYQSRYKRWRDRTFWILLFGAALGVLAVAIALWLWLRASAPPHRPEAPPPPLPSAPAPSATLPAPVPFSPALPPQPPAPAPPGPKPPKP
jgi:DNA-directed RNA polymerase specialized sigma24 family protein